MICGGVELGGHSHPPINLFYCHYHNSIRSELDRLSKSVLALEASRDDDVVDSLTQLKSKVVFLERVYSIHSSVEDEVPFLEGSQKLSACEVLHMSVPSGSSKPPSRTQSLAGCNIAFDWLLTSCRLSILPWMPR